MMMRSQTENLPTIDVKTFSAFLAFLGFFYCPAIFINIKKRRPTIPAVNYAAKRNGFISKYLPIHNLFITGKLCLFFVTVYRIQILLITCLLVNVKIRQWMMEPYYFEHEV